MSKRTRQSQRDAKRRKAKGRAAHKAKYRTWLDRKKPSVRMQPSVLTGAQLAAVVAMMHGEKP
ncbi:hypothetical protein MTsN3n11_24740 [Qipengyuania sp. MTN3-11]